MQIERRPDRLVLTDRSAAWLPRIFFALFIFAIVGLAIRDLGAYWWVLTFAGFFGLLGIGLLSMPLARVEIDRARRELHITERKLWGQKRTHLVRFEEVDRIDVETVSLEDGTSYYPRLVLKSGKAQRLSGADIHIEDRAVSLAALVRDEVFRRR